MLKVKPSKYLTLSLADSGNTSFHIYMSPAIKNILEINVCVFQSLCISQLKSSALHCQTVKCAAQQYCINTQNLQSVLTDLVTVRGRCYFQTQKFSKYFHVSSYTHQCQLNFGSGAVVHIFLQGQDQREHNSRWKRKTFPFILMLLF